MFRCLRVKLRMISNHPYFKGISNKQENIQGKMTKKYGSMTKVGVLRKLQTLGEEK